MSFDNQTEMRERLQAALERAERAESNAADLAAELQGARIALRAIMGMTSPTNGYGHTIHQIAKEALAKVQPMKTKGNQ